MTSVKRCYLLDVNVLVALLDERHIHHRLVTKWFNSPGLQWALCPFTEAGFLRYATRPNVGGMSMRDATAMISRIAERPGYSYQPISADWRTLCAPFNKRVFGHNQVTDAFLLGVAMRGGLVVATFDKAMLHLAREFGNHVLMLAEA
jgi:toxin-antitoxin system PIN domain toxin